MSQENLQKKSPTPSRGLVHTKIIANLYNHYEGTCRLRSVHIATIILMNNPLKS